MNKDYFGVRNISIKLCWKKNAAKRGEQYTIALQEMEACIVDGKTVEDKMDARELARIIEVFLDTLTVENRVIFLHRYWFSDVCLAVIVITVTNAAAAMGYDLVEWLRAARARHGYITFCSTATTEKCGKKRWLGTATK